MKSLISRFYGGLILLSAYVLAWAISDYLLNNTLLALLFLPFPLRLAVNLHLPKKCWFFTYSAEILALSLIMLISPHEYCFPAMILSLCSLPITAIMQEYYQGNERQKFAVQGILALGVAAFYALIAMVLSLPFSYAFLTAFSGMLLVLPSYFLGCEFLFKHCRISLKPKSVYHFILSQGRHILTYLFLFLLNMLIQIYTPEEFHRFALFFLSIPIILLAYYYGWQGAILGTLINSITLIGTVKHFSPDEFTDLFLLISTQTITGIFLGFAIQYQRDLNQSLSLELTRNRDLTRKLINTEEAIRRQISHELHDEIGQTITAIRTQAAIMKRLETSPKIVQISHTIERLSLNIYDTTKGMLNRIRPKMLDDLPLQQAIQNLFLELDFKMHEISTALYWENEENIPLDHIQEITLYRLCQEGLNNIVKYAEANNVRISVKIQQDIQLRIEDDGKGFDPEKVKYGFGLKGMQERVDVLCGTFRLIAREQATSPHWHGTRIDITLPRFNDE
ncbi:signal transduction histidine-protein kinase/phosphatase UhpB [Rodentibacter myodis]|uniref:Two-component system sensor histidine kinase UhpB n=1 Tax=Rodentibacter myodis TaxID=1907939 RepID=A0A1V3JKI8_9PAST|nr:signal transduction histidine-protein kinase/phosphatase UhpB [Rodentibacter myodis]OOF56969.1 two-component system sensor histidine kinase UhpB [Rodentibacter myodis]